MIKDQENLPPNTSENKLSDISDSDEQVIKDQKKVFLQIHLRKNSVIYPIVKKIFSKKRLKIHGKIQISEEIIMMTPVE